MVGNACNTTVSVLTEWTCIFCEEELSNCPLYEMGEAWHIPCWERFCVEREWAFSTPPDDYTQEPEEEEV